MNDDEEVRIRARKLIAAVRKYALRSGMGEPPPDTLQCLATMLIAAEIADMDESAPLRGIARAISSSSVANGISEDLTISAAVAAMRESFAAGRATRQ